MPASKTALLLIDIQNSFLCRPYWAEVIGLDEFKHHVLQLIQGAQERDIPIVNILHEDGDGPFSLASGQVKLQEWLTHSAQKTVIKHVHNAFTDTDLQQWLQNQGITRLVIAGIRTEQCCETTTRVAADLGFDVDFVTEATLTFPMRHQPSGKVFSAAEIYQRTELVLADRFASIVSAEQAVARMI